jgi:hypothetical protein
VKSSSLEFIPVRGKEKNNNMDVRRRQENTTIGRHACQGGRRGSQLGSSHAKGSEALPRTAKKPDSNQCITIRCVQDMVVKKIIYHLLLVFI